MRRRRARRTRKARRAASARRPSIGRRRRASCACARAAGRRDSRTCRALRSRRRFWLLRARRTIWATRRRRRGGPVGTCASLRARKPRFGWACWETYVGRPDGDRLRMGSMQRLGNALSATNRNADTLSVREAQLSELERTVLRVFGGAHLLVSETYKLPS